MKTNKMRVAILTGPNVRHLSTCATLIESGVNVVGICICNQNTISLPLRYILKSISGKGFLKVFGQIMGRIIYNLFNKILDNKIHKTLYDETKINLIMSKFHGGLRYSRDYSDPKTIQWLDTLQADIFVVHSGYWIGKKVRKLPRANIIIGGHPGLVPRYRGSHSAFWAIYHDHLEDVGTSIFWLDGGVDTGDLIDQELIEINDNDSFVTLGWKGMIQAAEMQSKVILDYENGIDIPRQKFILIPANSYFDVPTFLDYIKYRFKQNKVR